MSKIKRSAVILLTLAFLPGAALANTGECPEMSGVLEAVQPKGAGAKIDKPRLIAEVGKTAGDIASTADLANHLKTSLPGNQDAIVADLMIAAYCDFLVGSQGDISLDASVQNYQKTLYEEVFSNPEGVVVSDDHRPAGWLFGN